MTGRGVIPVGVRVSNVLIIELVWGCCSSTLHVPAPQTSAVVVSNLPIGRLASTGGFDSKVGGLGGEGGGAPVA